MQFDTIAKINQGILKNKKVVITLGCSFVEGQGAIDLKLWDYYKFDPTIPRDQWQEKFPHDSRSWGFTKAQQEEILSEFPDVYKDVNQRDDNLLNFTNHEVNNSFGNVLCKKYFNDEYTCINLGRRGNGNKSSIKDLYFYPDILWDKIEEIIVIYCPSGAERYDFIDDQFLPLNCHGRWVTIWPGGARGKPPYDEKSSPYDILCNGINAALYTEKSAILEQISHVQELILWCKYKKAKLIVTPAFMPTYDKEKFRTTLNTVYSRNGERKIIDEQFDVYDKKTIEKVINLWPWENMFYPNNEPTFADLCMAQETSIDRSAMWFYNFEYTGTPDRWITPCAHPSIKGHDLFAQYLYKHIVG